ncbi:solute carrier family 25 member 44-like [Rhodamnia argentea]|uniref:Solute carrier family 25 member 44-like n=1 Tax=Rhodamnia argentea TaxID=178133 RepID=A0ABM3HCC4_9MYRT|nr:solute carrier family 25 member 44-like [Rhodamnia argentea]
MSFGAAEEDSAPQIQLPADVDWHMLDKSRFFFLGAALFSGVSAALYPAVVLKTRQQVSHTAVSCFKMSFSIMRHEGLRGFYRGFGTSLMGTIPARALYMAALEVTKSSVGSATVKLGLSETSALAIANAVAGLSSAMAAQLVWTPVDVVSQRLMVQGQQNGFTSKKSLIDQVGIDSCRYKNGLDAFKKILCADGLRGLYRGFGISILTYAPSNAVWWASYSVANRLIWGGFVGQSGDRSRKDSCSSRSCFGAESRSMPTVAVQGLSAAMASGASAITTMPLDTIKTRLQVLDVEDNGRRRALTTMQAVRSMVREGGFGACYRGLGPRWASMAMSATTMITTYEFLKRISAKNQECFSS